jgi:hypothetical protein
LLSVIVSKSIACKLANFACAFPDARCSDSIHGAKTS